MGLGRDIFVAINSVSHRARSVDEAIELYEPLLGGEVGGAPPVGPVEE